MIGKKLKGVRHLMKMAESLGKVQFFFTTNGLDVQMGVAMLIPAKVVPNKYTRGADSDWVILFNHLMHNCHVNLDDFKRGTEIGDAVIDAANNFGHMYVVSTSATRFVDHSVRFMDIVALPEDFDKQYEDFCNANKKQVDSAVGNFFGNRNNITSKYIFALTDGSKNFYSWAVNAVFKYGHTLRTIEKIMAWNGIYGKMANKLKKGSITAYTGNHESLCRGLIYELHQLRRDKRANDVINTFNTAQKKMLKGYSLSDRDYDTLSRFAKLSFKKKSNFIKKMSSVDDVKEILRQMAFLADIHFEWNKQSFVEYLNNNENLNYDVILDKGDIMLIKVNDYETIKRLTKATNWCISKDKKYWNDYVEARSDSDQYVIFDFSRREDDNLSIVGFTCDKKHGITNSHDFQNRNLMNGHRGGGIVNEIKSFAMRHIDTNSIFSVLDRNGIDLALLMPSEPISFEWTREGVFERINMCIDEYDYYILADYGDRIVLMVEDSDIKYFLGDKLVDAINGMGNPNDYIIFIDLTKDKKDANKIIYGVVRFDHNKNEANVSRLYNSNSDQIGKSFDRMLEEWNLPYDVICRNDDIVERFYHAYANLELATCQDLIKNDRVKESLKSMENSGMVQTMLTNTIFQNYSMDYLNLFYNEGLKLSDVIPDNNIALQVLNLLYESYRHNAYNKAKPIPSEDEIKALFEDNDMDNSRSTYVGFYITLMSIIRHEDFSYRMYHELFNFMSNRSDYAELFDKVIIAMLQKSDFEHMELGRNTGVIRNILTLIFKRGNADALEIVAKFKANKDDTDTQRLINMCRDKAEELRKFEASRKAEFEKMKMKYSYKVSPSFTATISTNTF